MKKIKVKTGKKKKPCLSESDIKNAVMEIKIREIIPLSSLFIYLKIRKIIIVKNKDTSIFDDLKKLVEKKTAGVVKKIVP